MRVLTLPQPLAMLVVLGVKTMDARPWPCTYQGTLAIHAAYRLSPTGWDVAMSRRLRPYLLAAGYGDPEMLPLSAIVGLVEVVDAHRIHLADLATTIPGSERWLGDYRPGRSVLTFANPGRLKKPIPATGRPGLWSWEPPADIDWDRELAPPVKVSA